ncbi:MAG: glycerate kinase [Arcicella sp.]|jgi:glycerate kinase|nr:glycerate kinase [Arcicella sp.]
MNILIATDKFKDSLTALAVCEGLKTGIIQTFPEADCDILPLADGGEGTLETLQAVLGGQFITCTVHDPLFRKIEADYLWIPKTSTAIIEMARASGIELLDVSERNCLQTSTLGTGELILDAIQKNAKKIILTVGGSATNDGGIGMATALGYSFLDENKKVLKPIGENLIKIQSITQITHAVDLTKIQFTVATDVINPFYGINGAAHVFAPQKGADHTAVELLDEGLKNLSNLFEQFFRKNVQDLTGTGAGGGMGGGAVAFLNAEICSAADWILEVTQIAQKLQHTDLLITGEGKIDNQSWQGKLISRLLAKANEHHVPTILVCGTLQDPEQVIQQAGILYATSILNEPMSLLNALSNAPKLIQEQGHLLGKLLRSMKL